MKLATRFCLLPKKRRRLRDEYTCPVGVGWLRAFPGEDEEEAIDNEMKEDAER